MPPKPRLMLYLSTEQLNQLLHYKRCQCIDCCFLRQQNKEKALVYYYDTEGNFRIITKVPTEKRRRIGVMYNDS